MNTLSSNKNDERTEAVMPLSV